MVFLYDTYCPTSPRQIELVEFGLETSQSGVIRSLEGSVAEILFDRLKNDVDRSCVTDRFDHDLEMQLLYISTTSNRQTIMRVGTCTDMESVVYLAVRV